MSESLETVFGDAAPDPASDIAVAVMSLEWTKGGDEDEHCYRYGDIQEIADPIIKAALAEARAEGRRQGLEEAAKAVALAVLNAKDLSSRLRKSHNWNRTQAASAFANIAGQLEAALATATAPPETQKPDPKE